MQHMDPHRYRCRSVENVMGELRFIKTQMPFVKQVFFQEGTLIPSHAKELSEAILESDLDVCWGAYSRADVPRDILELMKQAGCRTLHIGYETPIQRYLGLIQKDISVEQMTMFAKNIKDLDMWTSATFMLFPWETPEEIRYTINWAKKIRPKRMNFIQAQAYPNTPYANTLQGMKGRKLMGFEEMKKWEQWGFKQFYLYNLHFWWEVLKNPSEWKNVIKDALGLVKFLEEK